MPSIAELQKLRARVEKERAKASGHDAAALDKIMDAKRQAEADELNRELERLQAASEARGKSAEQAQGETPEDEATRLLKAAAKAMNGTPVEEIKTPRPSTSAQSSTATPTNEGK